MQTGVTTDDDAAREASHRGDGEAHRERGGRLRGCPQVMSKATKFWWEILNDFWREM